MQGSVTSSPSCSLSLAGMGALHQEAFPNPVTTLQPACWLSQLRVPPTAGCLTCVPVCAPCASLYPGVCHCSPGPWCEVLSPCFLKETSVEVLQGWG